MVPELIETSKVINSIRVDQRLHGYISPRLFVAHPQIPTGLNEGLRVEESLQEIVGYILVAQANVVHVVEKPLLHDLLDQLVAPRVRHFIVDKLLLQQISYY